MTPSGSSSRKSFLASLLGKITAALVATTALGGALLGLQKTYASLHETVLLPASESLECMTSGQARQEVYLLNKHGIYKCVGLGKVWLDTNSRIAGIAIINRSLFARHRDGKIWKSTLEVCTDPKKNDCPGWKLVDYNSKTTRISSDNANLYKHDSSGRAWMYTDPGYYCKEDDVTIGKDCPGWTLLETGKDPRHLSKERSL
jgi:hypothetical protein